ncbi:hypothetical protein [Mangrovibacterium diazotrophicum]|uniref:Uncharacterized protein n=1 Tax=Mangrovibacterium diazotrophicum TaxID=1261403 RepID=A0A419W3M5_9BACT|nr:hypothetical protein [Mangrovibacterium diazotrophicum]RKD90053.1 hypothetical protein BC643_0389 [Mangrovibacterium diazotrophicum]
MAGWISLYREIQNHWIFKDDKQFKWWVIILLNVNHSASKFTVGLELHICNPGQSFRSIEQWTSLFGCSKKTTVKFFELLETEGMIVREILGSGNRRKHLLTVRNWRKYQESETETVPETPPKGYPNITSNKKDKNEKNKREGKTICFSPPSLLEIQKCFATKIEEKGFTLNASQEAEKFEAFYSSKNWMVGKNKMTRWEKAVSGWIARMRPEKTNPKCQTPNYQEPRLKLDAI